MCECYPCYPGGSIAVFNGENCMEGADGGSQEVILSVKATKDTGMCS